MTWHGMGRLTQFDERSRDHDVGSLWAGARRAAAGRLTSRTWACAKVLDQGESDACVGHGWAAELIARPVVVTGVTERFAQDYYHAAQMRDGVRGVHSGSTVLAGAKTGVAMGFYEGYRWAFSEADLALAISLVGPTVIGIPWREGMMETNTDGYIYPLGEYVGGHCVLVRGISIVRSAYLIRNSWGRGWGLSGDCWIKREDLWALLRDGGEACIPTRKADKTHV